MLGQGLLLGLLGSWAVTQAVRGPTPQSHSWALDARVLGNQGSCFESRVSSVAGACPRVYVCVLRSPQETRVEPEEQGPQGMCAKHVGYAGRPPGPAVPSWGVLSRQSFHPDPYLALLTVPPNLTKNDKAFH